MTTILLIGGLVLYLVFYFTYGKKLEKNLIKAESGPETPSKRLEDGVDYIPTNKYVLFGHHFASIAGAGPIVGPAMAIAWGWLPSLLWVWIGNVFIGAIHDYFSLSASVRYDGRSIQFISQDLVGKKPGKSFGWFLLFLSILVVAAFSAVVVSQFTTPGTGGKIAGAFIYFLIAALILGVLLYRTKLPFSVSTLIGLGLLIGAFVLGNVLPITLPANAWYPILLLYIVIAAALPVNVLLQPRDYLNSYLLYFGLIVGGLSAIISMAPLDKVAPFVEFAPKMIGGQPTPFWPAVPLIIACGALSGFHSLVASGTTSKQLKSEKDGLFVGYGSMLAEGLLSTIVILSIAGFATTEVLGMKAVGRFTHSFALMADHAFGGILKGVDIVNPLIVFAGIWVSSFALTTLDTTNRLGRYIVGELALPLKNKNKQVYDFFSNKWVGSFIVAALGVALGWSGQYTLLWPAFSGANQLVASIALVTVAMWVKKRLDKRYTNVALIPAIFTWVTVTTGLIWYEFAVVPPMFQVGTTKSLITGIVVGVMTLIMLVLNFMIMIPVIKGFNEPYTPSEVAEDKQ